MTKRGISEADVARVLAEREQTGLERGGPEVIEGRIFVARGHKVMLDSDLAQVYRVSVKRLNEQVRRNRHRFPPDFMLQMTGDEAESLRSQIATLKTGRGKHRKYRPYALAHETPDQQVRQAERDAKLLGKGSLRGAEVRFDDVDGSTPLTVDPELAERVEDPPGVVFVGGGGRHFVPVSYRLANRSW